ncbi:pilus assembly FimT family protein [Nautilia sp.]
MRKLGFTLIELLTVIILMGVITFLAVKLPEFSQKHTSVTDLRKELYPDGFITVYKNGRIKSDKKTVFRCLNPFVYEYKDGRFEKKTFEDEKIFEYRVVNGIGESFILSCKDGYYVFKPFSVTRAESLKKAQELFLCKGYEPSDGNVK